MTQTTDDMLPIEVKAEVNVKAKSLRIITSENNIKGVRFSMLPYIDQGWMENVPLYAVEAYSNIRGV